MKRILNLVLVLLVGGMSLSSYAAEPKSAQNSVSGHYEMEAGAATGLMEVVQNPGGKITFAGNATWVGTNFGQVNTGNLKRTLELKGNTALYNWGDKDSIKCQLKFVFEKKYLQIEQKGFCGGLNVSFAGKYKRTGPPNMKNMKEIGEISD